MILPLLHGYTTGDLDRLARVAARRRYARATWDFAERVDMAWSAMALFLASAEERPYRDELVRAGLDEIRRGHREELHHWGFNGFDRSSGPCSAPRFAAYWIRPAEPSHEARIIERMATAQIWPALSALDRRVLVAAALHDHHDAAAAAVGVSREAFRLRLNRARHAFLALWHQGETPSRPWHTRGTRWTPEPARCAAEGCAGAVEAHGWCRKHYMRWYRHGDAQEEVA